MAEYRDHRLRLRLLSPLGTPLQSDTIVGHLAWQAAFREGDQGVKGFLEPFLIGRPPFILSDGFPAGLLPRPLLPRGPGLTRSSERLSLEKFTRDKHLLKAPLVTVEDFRELCSGSGKISSSPMENPWISTQTAHAAIDRSTDTTTPGGQLYETLAEALPGEKVDLYLRAAEDGADRVAGMLEDISRIGYGRYKTVGMGQFRVESCQPWDEFRGPEEADGFVSLSSFMPASTDPTEGRWRIRIKRGFLGEGAGGGYPYKKPLIQFEPGAVFRAGPEGPRPFYGRVVAGVAPGMPEAVQCCYTLSVPCRYAPLKAGAG
ncbi:MAG: hypothetical protein JRJ59_09750 [Deltaproteobacteria bacterium]|nr:hypothetical protein [Deltaproteobacteria bacterium]